MSDHDKNKSVLPLATAIIIPCVVLTLCAVLFININESKKKEVAEGQPINESHGMVDGYSIPEDAMYLWQYDWEDIKEEAAPEADVSVSESVTGYTMDPELSSLLMLGNEDMTDIMADIYNNIVPPEQQGSLPPPVETTTDFFNGQTVVAKRIITEDKCTGVTIYINGEYEASTFGVLTVKITEQNVMHRLLYDLAVGLCTDTDDSEKYIDLSSVKTENGVTIATVIFPPKKCYPVSQITKLSLNLSYSLFRNENGERLGEVDVLAE